MEEIVLAAATPLPWHERKNYREILEADQAKHELTEIRQAAYGYLARSLDK